MLHHIVIVFNGTDGLNSFVVQSLKALDLILQLISQLLILLLLNGQFLKSILQLIKIQNLHLVVRQRVHSPFKSRKQPLEFLLVRNEVILKVLEVVVHFQFLFLSGNLFVLCLEVNDHIEHLLVGALHFGQLYEVLFDLNDLSQLLVLIFLVFFLLFRVLLFFSLFCFIFDFHLFVLPNLQLSGFQFLFL